MKVALGQRVLTALEDAGWLALVVLALPTAIVVMGLPIAAIVWVISTLAQ